MRRFQEEGDGGDQGHHHGQQQIEWHEAAGMIARQARGPWRRRAHGRDQVDDGTEVIPQVPTLVLWGEDDKFTKVSMGQNLAKMIPNAEFKLFVGAGHMPQIEKPDEFAKSVNGFLNDGL